MKKLFFLIVLIPVISSCSGRRDASAQKSQTPEDEIIVEIIPDTLPVDSLSADKIAADTLSLDTLVSDTVIPAGK